jgi:hypothetical protein
MGAGGQTPLAASYSYDGVRRWRGSLNPKALKLVRLRRIYFIIQYSSFNIYPPMADSIFFSPLPFPLFPIIITSISLRGNCESMIQLTAG